MENLLETLLKSELTKLGQQLRTLRTERGWTLSELSEQADVSEAYLSRLECGERQPSLAVLFNLVRVYGVSLPDLFGSTSENSKPVAPKASTGVVIRAGDRLLQEGNGLRYTSLAGGNHLADLHPLRVIVPIDRPAEHHYQHSGEEWLYVLSGQLILTLVGEQFLLNPRDAAHFDAFLPHDISATGEQDAEILLVACTPTRSLLKSYLTEKS
ncbi:MAG: XRE family transcriptional regulator [Pleurocapsa minor HA4230-MV1]|jgi:transcriptional regulator with XRE-family HTH domain|nr:XRE family transcriptional regulator [Pleurocapsa minor HA4230-MV1]